MKKIVSAILVLIFISSLCACAPQEGLLSASESSLSSGATSASNSSVSASVSGSNSQSVPRRTYTKETIMVPEQWTPDSAPSTGEEMTAYTKAEENTGWTPVDTISVEGTYAGNFPIVTNETPLSEMMSVLYDPYLVMALMRTTEDFFPPANHNPSLQALLEEKNVYNNSIPINFLRTTGEGLYYTVCKMENGGLAYFFFQRPRVNREGELAIFSTDDMTDVYLSGALYAEKKLSYSDFTDIQIGDSIDKVIAIDNAALLEKTRQEWLNGVLDGRTFNEAASLHLLTDGILEIRYAYVNKQLVVSELNYFKDFIYKPSILYDLTGTPVEVDLSILPQDYPQ